MKRFPKYREVRRVALYLRVSTSEQTKGHSLDSQRTELVAWARSQGWEIAKVYEDAGASGTSVEGRTGFQQMIADAQAGSFDAVLVLKVDRFARSMRDATLYRELLNDHGVQIKSRTEPGVGERTPAGFLMGGMSDLWSEFYSVQLSDNVARGMATRARKGLPLGDIPFGYRRTSPDEPPAIVPEEAEAVRRGFERYAAGDQSMLGTADFLNAAGFRPRSKRGRLVFSKATVRGMLENPVYVGDITHHGEVIGRGRHEPIVSRELWEKVQQVRNERARRPQVYGARPKRPYLLSGVAFCSACGSPLWANTTSGGRHNYYRCSSRSRGEDCSDGIFSCRAEHPENELSRLFIRLELPPAWRERVKELVSTGGAGLAVERERQRLNEKIARVRRGLIDGILDDETARAAVREAEATLRALPRVDGASVQAGESLTDIRELWPHMAGGERRDLVRLVLAKVEVDLRTGSVGGLIPKPAFAPLFRVLAEEEDGLISVCNWRPRGDSNPRSPA